MADEFIEQNCDDYLILRPSYLFGPYGSNSFVRRTLSFLLTKDYVAKIPSNQFIVPTTTKLLIDVMNLYADDRISSGMYNIRLETVDRCPSKYEIAKYMRDILDEGTVEECEYVPFEGTAKRQLNSFLDISKLKESFHMINGPCKVDILNWKTEILHVLEPLK